MNSILALGSLFASSFLSATLLPGNSEAVFTGLLLYSSLSPFKLLVVASIGNTLGGLTNVVIGRFISRIKPQRGLRTAQRWLERYGAIVLLLSWLPIIGDLLCVLAGWLRLRLPLVILFILLGKSLRYLFLCAVVLSWLK